MATEQKELTRQEMERLLAQRKRAEGIEAYWAGIEEKRATATRALEQRTAMRKRREASIADCGKAIKRLQAPAAKLEAAAALGHSASIFALRDLRLEIERLQAEQRQASGGIVGDLEAVRQAGELLARLPSRKEQERIFAEAEAAMAALKGATKK